MEVFLARVSTWATTLFKLPLKALDIVGLHRAAVRFEACFAHSKVACQSEWSAHATRTLAQTLGGGVQRQYRPRSRERHPLITSHQDCGTQTRVGLVSPLLSGHAGTNVGPALPSTELLDALSPNAWATASPDPRASELNTDGVRLVLIFFELVVGFGEEAGGGGVRRSPRATFVGRMASSFNS